MDKLLRRAIRSRIDDLKILRDAICGLCRLAIAFSGARLLAWVFPITAVVRPLVQGTIGDYSGKGSPAGSGMNHGTINPIT